MLALTIAATVLLIWLVVAAGGGWRTREHLDAPQPARSGDPDCCDDITALIPARNEQAHIGACLSAVAPQVAAAIVVDDESTDDTARVAREHAAGNVSVITGQPLPAGWTGKLWALEQGLAQVRTPLVLLLDADIVPAAGLVAALRDKRVTSGATLVSLMASLRMETFWERWLYPPFVYFFKLIYPFHAVNRPASRTGAAAGGCILVERTALTLAGAFSAWRDAVIDDCTLAQRIRQDGGSLWLGLTHSVHSLRRATTLGDIWNMVARTAFTQLRYSWFWLLACTVVMVLAFWAPPLLTVFGHGITRGLAASAWVLMTFVYVPVLRYYGRPVWWALALPVTAAAFLAMTWSSAWRYRSGTRSVWKDRTYPAGAGH